MPSYKPSYQTRILLYCCGCVFSHHDKPLETCTNDTRKPSTAIQQATECEYVQQYPATAAAIFNGQSYSSSTITTSTNLYRIFDIHGYLIPVVWYHTYHTAVDTLWVYEYTLGWSADGEYEYHTTVNPLPIINRLTAKYDSSHNSFFSPPKSGHTPVKGYNRSTRAYQCSSAAITRGVIHQIPFNIFRENNPAPWLTARA